jgi:hypothetical protein
MDRLNRSDSAVDGEVAECNCLDDCLVDHDNARSAG